MKLVDLGEKQSLTNIAFVTVSIALKNHPCKKGSPVVECPVGTFWGKFLKWPTHQTNQKKGAIQQLNGGTKKTKSSQGQKSHSQRQALTLDHSFQLGNHK